MSQIGLLQSCLLTKNVPSLVSRNQMRWLLCSWLRAPLSASTQPKSSLQAFSQAQVLSACSGCVWCFLAAFSACFWEFFLLLSLMYSLLLKLLSVSWPLKQYPAMPISHMVQIPECSACGFVLGSGMCLCLAWRPLLFRKGAELSLKEGPGSPPHQRQWVHPSASVTFCPTHNYNKLWGTANRNEVTSCFTLHYELN